MELRRKCYKCGESKTDVIFCKHCHFWLCDECAYQTVCFLNNDGAHEPVDLTKKAAERAAKIVLSDIQEIDTGWEM